MNKFRKLIVFGPDEGSAAADGGAAAPASTTPAADPPASAENDLTGFEFLSLDEPDEGFEASPEPSPAPPQSPPSPSPQEPAAPAGTGATPTPAAATPPQPAPTAPSAPADQGPTPAAAAPAATPASPAADPQPTVVEQLTQNRDALIEQLAANSYQFSEEDLAALGFDSDAGKKIGTLAARIHLNAVTAVYHALQTQVPAMIAKAVPVVLEQQSQRRTYAERFTRAWPKLDGNNPQHAEVIGRIAKTYVGANPNASAEDAIKHIGATASALLGLPIEMTVESANGAPAAAPPGTPPGARRVTPPQPAIGGSLPPQPPAPDDPWAGLATDYDEGF